MELWDFQKYMCLSGRFEPRCYHDSIIPIGNSGMWGPKLWLNSFKWYEPLNGEIKKKHWRERSVKEREITVKAQSYA